jgi:hypothetical protein
MNKFISIFLAAVVTVLSGCATPASQNAMAIGVQDISGKLNSGLKEQLNVRVVTGGKETNPLWTSQVDNVGFKGALDQSLIAIGYKSKTAADAKMQIDASLQNIEQPLFGLTFDVKSTVLYTVNSDSGQKVFPVTATGSASTSDAFLGFERLRIANERSIKENIKQFIQTISTFYNK